MCCRKHRRQAYASQNGYAVLQTGGPCGPTTNMSYTGTCRGNGRRNPRAHGPLRLLVLAMVEHYRDRKERKRAERLAITENDALVMTENEKDAVTGIVNDRPPTYEEVSGQAATEVKGKF